MHANFLQGAYLSILTLENSMNKNKKKYLIYFLIIFLYYPVKVSSEICQKLEFAELDSLPKEELLRLRCDYYKEELQAINNQYESVFSGKSGGRGYESVSVRCGEEQTRMERILIKKYNLKPKDNNPYDLMIQISQMCNSR
jgi:hypothetical protein